MCIKSTISTTILTYKIYFFKKQFCNVKRLLLVKAFSQNKDAETPPPTRGVMILTVKKEDCAILAKYKINMIQNLLRERQSR